jgi:hypothetical protein
MSKPCLLIYTRNFEEGDRIDITGDLYGSVSICPFCLKMTDCDKCFPETVLDYDEMFVCVKCDARCILQKKITILDETEIRNRLPKYPIDELIDTINDISTMPVHPNDPYDAFLLIDLVKILKISNEQIYKYRITNLIDYRPYLKNIFTGVVIPIINEYIQFSDKNLHNLMICDIPDRQFKIGRDTSFDMVSKKYAKKKDRILSRYNIVEFDISKILTTTPRDDVYFWNISMPVNSYNINKPEDPYPSWFDLKTDRLVLVLYENENGDRKNTWYCTGY